MAIDVTTVAGEEPVTALHGEVMAQPARVAVDQLYSLQLTILSVVRLKMCTGS